MLIILLNDYWFLFGSGDWLVFICVVLSLFLLAYFDLHVVYKRVAL